MKNLSTRLSYLALSVALYGFAANGALAMVDDDSIKEAMEENSPRVSPSLSPRVSPSSSPIVLAEEEAVDPMATCTQELVEIINEDNSTSGSEPLDLVGKVSETPEPEEDGSVESQSDETHSLPDTASEARSSASPSPQLDEKVDDEEKDGVTDGSQVSETASDTPVIEDEEPSTDEPEASAGTSVASSSSSPSTAEDSDLARLVEEVKAVKSKLLELETMKNRLLPRVRVAGTTLDAIKKGGDGAEETLAYASPRKDIEALKHVGRLIEEQIEGFAELRDAEITLQNLVYDVRVQEVSQELKSIGDSINVLDEYLARA